MKTRNPVLTTAIACAAMALAAVTVALVLGHPRSGIALAAGLLVGSSNGYLAQRGLSFAGAFRATSGFRMALLTIVGLGVGLVCGLDVAWLSLLGVGLSQLVLAAVAASTLIRR